MVASGVVGRESDHTIRKMVKKMLEMEKARGRIPNRVVNPPFHTLGAMYCIVFRTRSNRVPEVSRKAWMMWTTRSSAKPREDISSTRETAGTWVGSEFGRPSSFLCKAWETPTNLQSGGNGESTDN